MPRPPLRSLAHALVVLALGLGGAMRIAAAAGAADCQPGTYWDGSSCSPCTISFGYYSSKAGATACQRCGNGTVPNEIGTACVACPAGTSATVGDGWCKPCYYGYYSPKPSSSTCQRCGNGTVPNENRTACVACPAGQFAVASGYGCSRCPTYLGLVSTKPPSSDCTQCPAGTAPNDNGSACVTCPAGTFASPGGSSCASCSTYQGLVSTKAGSSNCTQCPAGTAPNYNGTACVTCPAGTFATPGAGSCASCATYQGLVSTKAGSSNCTQCPAGTVPNNNGSACVACPVGTFATPGSGSCSSCPTGQFASKPGSASCIVCPLGTQGISGGSGCAACPVAQDAVHEVVAEDGSVGAKCQTCTNTTLDTLPGSCAKGQGRQSCAADAKCVACPPGSFATVSVQTTMDSCRACPYNTYSAKPGSTACTPCPAGRAFRGRGASTAVLCTFVYDATKSFSLRESITYQGAGVFGGAPFREQAASVPRVVQAKSGQTITPLANFPGGGGTNLHHYNVFTMPDGKWLVDVALSEGGTVSCAALPGPLNLTCVFKSGAYFVSTSTASTASWRLLLQQV